MYKSLILFYMKQQVYVKCLRLIKYLRHEFHQLADVKYRLELELRGFCFINPYDFVLGIWFHKKLKNGSPTRVYIYIVNLWTSVVISFLRFRWFLRPNWNETVTPPHGFHTPFHLSRPIFSPALFFKYHSFHCARFWIRCD